MHLSYLLAVYYYVAKMSSSAEEETLPTLPYKCTVCSQAPQEVSNIYGKIQLVEIHVTFSFLLCKETNFPPHFLMSAAALFLSYFISNRLSCLGVTLGERFSKSMICFRSSSPIVPLFLSMSNKSANLSFFISFSSEQCT